METTQQVFDRVVTAFFIDGIEPGWDVAESCCVYFDDATKSRCALGIAVPLKAARFLGNRTVSASGVPCELEDDYPEVALFVEEHLRVLQALQGAHDAAARVSFRPDGVCNRAAFRERFKRKILENLSQSEKVTVDTTILRKWEE